MKRVRSPVKPSRYSNETKRVLQCVCCVPRGSRAMRTNRINQSAIVAEETQKTRFHPAPLPSHPPFLSGKKRPRPTPKIQRRWCATESTKGTVFVYTYENHSHIFIFAFLGVGRKQRRTFLGVDGAGTNKKDVAALSPLLLSLPNEKPLDSIKAFPSAGLMGASAPNPWTASTSPPHPSPRSRNKAAKSHKRTRAKT